MTINITDQLQATDGRRIPGSSEMQAAHTHREDILQAIVHHYTQSTDFNGLLIRRFMEERQILWEHGMTALAELVREKRITLNFAEMNPFVKNFPDLPVSEQLDRLGRLDEPCLLCAYPTAAAVGDFINQHANRPFSQMLAAGRGHLEPMFFDLSVLELYANDPRYHFEFRCYSGWLALQDEFCAGEDTQDRDKVYLKSFGLGYDGKGHRVLAVYLSYLARLSPEHQQYWRTKQLPGGCKILKEYVDNTLLGIWTDTGSYYAALLLEQVEINKLCKLIGRPAFFRETFERSWPPGYSIFFRPTRRKFLSFVHTLDKLLSDNISKDFFQGEVPDKEVVEVSPGLREQRMVGTLAMLKNWLAQHIQFSSPDGLKVLMEPLREVRELRSRNAHQIIEDEFSPKYHEEQDRLVVSAYHSVAGLRRLLATHPDAGEYAEPDFLNQDKLRLF